MKKIDISTKLFPNRFALVDDEDYERMNKWKWRPMRGGKKFYAERSIFVRGMKDIKISMAREILRYVGGKEIDHKDGDTLNNQKNNIRLCTHQQNMMNTTKRKDNISGYKGVSYSKQAKKWRSEIGVNSKRIFLGYFFNKIDAVREYNKAALKYHGEFACLNEV